MNTPKKAWYSFLILRGRNKRKIESVVEKRKNIKN
jgi:hypothetical protein